MKIKIKPKYKDDTVLDVLRRKKIYLCADCGGKGTCGKCRVRFDDAASCTEPTEREKDLISDWEIRNGVRLACQVNAYDLMSSNGKKHPETSAGTNRTGETDGKDDTDGIEIEIPNSSLLRDMGTSEVDIRKMEPLGNSEIIAVDIGTTMIDGALVDLNVGVKAEASVINHQKAYGADVLSRIRAANDGYGEELRLIAMDDLAELAEKLGRDPEKARYIISGNTVMEHIASGFSCKGLGEYPYTPVDLSLRRDGDMTFLPGISAFVGADIVSGICACSLDKAEAPWIYLDVGTNGEMALGTGSEIIAASSPAGPAFEGGELSCGMPAVQGAVNECHIAGRRAVVKTVGGARPIGICGSGIIDVTAELLRNRLIDRNGTFAGEDAEEMLEEGFALAHGVSVTQKDIREIQKAKAAIRAGMEILIGESGIKKSEISKLVIAGSFGSSIDMANAAAIGLFPEELIDVAATAGNASLTGATLYALDTGFRLRLEKVAEEAKTIELSETPGFAQKYVSFMGF